MNAEKFKRSNANPRQNANPLSKIFFTYAADLFTSGFRRNLDEDDLYDTLPSYKSEHLGDKLEKNWKLSKSKKPSLTAALARTFWPEYTHLAVLLVIMDMVIQVSNPLMLGKLLQYFRDGSEMTRDEALKYASAVVILNTLNTFFNIHYTTYSYFYGLKVRAACCTVIYRKVLKLSAAALGQSTSGKIMNLLATDVGRFDTVSYFIPYLCVSPFTTIVVTYLLYREGGLGALAGIIPIMFAIPTHSIVGTISSIARSKATKKTDERIRLMDEIISGIQVIKMYTWEIPFSKMIQLARKLEMKVISRISYNRGIFMTLNMTTSRIALFCTLIALVMSGKKISADTVFVFTCYFNVLSQSVCSYFARAISDSAELYVIVKRIQKFLVMEEFEDIAEVAPGNQEDLISLKNVDVKWSDDQSVLYDLNLEVKRGMLVGVIGPVGSGKSSLLQTILGELKIASGNISIKGTISYASQEPWLFAGSVKQNILFGSKYNKKKYDQVIEACALDSDFKKLKGGDECYIGEKGISLSGGQKARVNLARALYRDADVYLLDDPLSAVDIHVSKHIFKRAINGYLKNKTRILVTHQVHYLQSAEKILLLNNGHIFSDSDFTSLTSNKNPVFSNLLDMDLIELERRSSAAVTVKGVTPPVEEPVDNSDFQEASSKGKVKGSLFLKYIGAGGNPCFVLTVFLLFIIAQTGVCMVDYFVSIWTNLLDKKMPSGTVSVFDLITVTLRTDEFITIYTGLIVALFFIALTRSLLFFKLATKASKCLHTKMFEGVVGTIMKFFHNNPSGRILNRFSKDISSIDETLPRATFDAAQIILNLLGALVLVVVVNPYFLIPVGVMAVIFMIMRAIYLKSSKSIKRMESMMRSPVFTHINATIQGISTIRSYGAQQTLSKEFDVHQNVHTSSYYMYLTASAAFGFYLDLICGVFTAVVTFSFLEFYKDSTGVGKVGLAITQATSLTGVIQWGIRQSAEVANQLMSVERVLEYTLLSKEIDPPDPKIPTNWPSEGRVVFKNVDMRYSKEGKKVLKDINLVIEPKEKIGVVGRTGAGKSSIISALYRLALVEGTVEIDGVDTKEISLETLRKNISIIPQDPVLFSGTIRYNLDPFGEYHDDVLWKALEEVELKSCPNLISNLDTIVMDQGSNFSVGQRQLICLARAIVRNNMVLVMDEATANVDPQTDALIQNTIRRKFCDCTVLTIAHRLNTVIDSDRILVMHAGEVVEFAHPRTLLRDDQSHFHMMVKAIGKSMLNEFKRISEQAFNTKYMEVTKL